MAKKQLSEEDIKNIQILQANNEMLEKTKEEARIRGKMKSVERIQIAQQEVQDHIRSIDSEANLLPENSSVGDDNNSAFGVYYDDEATVFDSINEMSENKKIELEEKTTTETKISDYVSVPKISAYDIEDISSNEQYDIISLPSNGECYKGKIGKVPVAFLTAYDENFLTSPNLYKDGVVIDFLLKQKVLKSKINVDDLVSGDADAIILFLRATSYGVDFPIVVNDPDTGEQIESTVDLSTLKSKEFTLIGDENGWFDYTMPVTHDEIKFRYLTRKDNKNLALLNNLETSGYKSMKLNEMTSTLSNFIKTDKLLDGKTKQEYMSYINKLKEWQKKLSNEKSLPFSKSVTNKMEMHIMSVNGNTDRAFISKYVKTMNTQDALHFRRYVIENEPGIDWTIEVEKPGRPGETFKTFLELDDTLFLNISQL